MKEFLNIIMRDYASEGFTRKDWLYYGILFPLVLGTLVLLIGNIENF